MRISLKTVCGTLCLFLATSALHAQEKSPKEMEKSCRAFVQGFYNWYVRQDQTGGVPILEDLLDLKRNAFSPELRRRLKQDVKEARADTDWDITGLDFDPFIAGNGGPLGRYVVGRITPHGDRYWVEVYLIQSTKRSRKPVVIPEVQFQGGRWVFVNFRYGKHKGDDLLSTLAELRAERRKHSK